MFLQCLDKKKEKQPKKSAVKSFRVNVHLNYSLPKSSSLFFLQIFIKRMGALAIDVNFGKHVKLNTKFILGKLLDLLIGSWFLKG